MAISFAHRKTLSKLIGKPFKQFMKYVEYEFENLPNFLKALTSFQYQLPRLFLN